MQNRILLLEDHPDFLDSFISGSGSLFVYTVQVAPYLCLLSKTVYLYIKGFPSEWWEPVDI